MSNEYFSTFKITLFTNYFYIIYFNCCVQSSFLTQLLPPTTLNFFHDEQLIFIAICRYVSIYLFYTQTMSINTDRRNCFTVD